jgi:hypothetical protein
MTANDHLWKCLSCQNNPCVCPNPAGPENDTAAEACVEHKLSYCNRAPWEYALPLYESKNLRKSTLGIEEDVRETSTNDSKRTCPNCGRNPCTCCRTCCTTPCCCGTKPPAQAVDPSACKMRPEDSKPLKLCSKCKSDPCKCPRSASIEDENFCSTCGQYPCRCGLVKPTPGNNEDSVCGPLDDYDCLGCGKSESTCECGCIWLVMSP